MESYKKWRVTDCEVIIGELPKYDVTKFCFFTIFDGHTHMTVTLHLASFVKKWRVTVNLNSPKNFSVKKWRVTVKLNSPLSFVVKKWTVKGCYSLL